MGEMNDTGAEQNVGRIRALKRGQRLIVLLLLVVVLVAVYAHWPETGPPTVSPATTYLTEPLRPDGTVDYLAAVNDRLSAGVTESENAAPLIIQALGPGSMWRPGERNAAADAVLHNLGVAPFPEDGVYFLPLDTWPFDRWDQWLVPEDGRELLEKADEIRQDLETAIATGRPPSQSSDAAKWLEINRGPLSLLEQATDRPILYVPRWNVPGQPDGLCYSEGLALPGAYDVGLALCARALTEIEVGKGVSAMGELLACHRWSRLVGQSTPQSQIAPMIDAAAVRTETAIVANGLAAEAEVRDMLKQVDQLRPLRIPADVTDLDERLDMLSIITAFYRKGELRHLASNDPPFAYAPRHLDWDYVLTEINAWWPKRVAAVGEDTHRDYVNAMEGLRKEYDAAFPAAEGILDGPVFKPSVVEKMCQLGGRFSRRRLSRRWVIRLLSLQTDNPFWMRLRHDARRAYLRMRDIVFSLAEYESEHGRYPDTLDGLVAAGMGPVPTDPFTGSPFVYERTPGGYKLYSVGPNLAEDGGPAVGEESCEADDIGIVVEKTPVAARR